MRGERAPVYDCAFKTIFVIARNSASPNKDEATDVKQIGRELGVRYVLEGSVRKSDTHYGPIDRRHNRNASLGRPVSWCNRRYL